MRRLDRISNRIYHIGLGAVQLLTLLLMAGLTLCSLFWGYYAEDMDSQISVPHNHPLPLHLAGLTVLLLLLFLLFFSSRRHAVRLRSILLGITLCWVCFWGLFLILCGRSIPTADSASVYSIANALASGQMGVIHPTDSYLSYYPQQIGLVAYYELIIRLWNLLPFPYAAYYILQCLNVGMACIIVYSQYRITYLLSGSSDHAAIAYLFLAMLNAPLLIYTSFVYGEIPSFAFLSGGLCLLLSCHAGPPLSPRRRYLYPAFGLILLILSVALRKNALIIVIAVVIATFWEWLKRRNHFLLLYAVLLIAGSLLILPGIQRIYEYRAGNTLSTGVPAISYVAMGMQESSRGNGWYNGFNFSTYENSYLDVEVASQKSRDAIRTSLSAFQADPGYALRFYAEKFLSQWTDGTYFCRQATLHHTDGRTRFVEKLYTGSLSLPFNHYCDIYQLLVYGSALLCLLQQWSRRKKPSASGLPLYTGMIAVLGGFLFHMVWEANSRYIFPYFLLLLPYAAWGLGTLYTALMQRK